SGSDSNRAQDPRLRYRRSLRPTGRTGARQDQAQSAPAGGGSTMIQTVGRFAGALAWILVAGCASQQGPETALQPEVSTPREEAPDRLRARIHTELAAGYFELGNMSV